LNTLVYFANGKSINDASPQQRNVAKVSKPTLPAAGSFLFSGGGDFKLLRIVVEGAVPAFRIIAKYQPPVDHAMFGRFLALITSRRLKWTHDCNPDGTGHVYKITAYERKGAVHIKDELTKLGMEVELTETRN